MLGGHRLTSLPELQPQAFTAASAMTLVEKYGMQATGSDKVAAPVSLFKVVPDSSILPVMVPQDSFSRQLESRGASTRHRVHAPQPGLPHIGGAGNQRNNLGARSSRSNDLPLSSRAGSDLAASSRGKLDFTDCDTPHHHDQTPTTNQPPATVRLSMASRGQMSSRSGTASSRSRLGINGYVERHVSDSILADHEVVMSSNFHDQIQERMDRAEATFAELEVGYLARQADTLGKWKSGVGKGLDSAAKRVSPFSLSL